MQLLFGFPLFHVLFPNVHIQVRVMITRFCLDLFHLLDSNLVQFHFCLDTFRS
ncbi:hypothetical protein Hdeb2414_s0005g00174991 [Helianthus debilis subsp. tardiflorus]